MIFKKCVSMHHAWTPVVVCRLSCSIACGVVVSLPGIKPASPALQGILLITGHPEESPGSVDFDCS